MTKEWNAETGKLDGPPHPYTADAAKVIIREVLLFLLKLPQNEIRGKQLDWINTIADFAQKHEINL